MTRFKDEIVKLNEVDTYSLILFALFKLQDIPEYSSLSELVYILDKESLLKLCEYFGGMTLKIPTIEELEYLVQALVLYQCINIDKMEYEEAVKLIAARSTDIFKVKNDYRKLCKLLDEYDIKSR